MQRSSTPPRHREPLRAGTLLTATLIAVGVATPATADESAPAITWEQCPIQVTQTNAECGRVDVPLSYDDPAGADISVGFVRFKAEDTQARRGVLFGNPGGPGGDGYSYFDAGNDLLEWPQEIRNEWDLVAVQPRGLYGSTPVECTTPAPQNEAEMAVLSAQSMLSAGALQRDLCAGPVNSSLTTENTARDWDVVRRALGEEQISIMGLSYGTFLGSTYASLFPQHTDRVVLDSAMDPTLAWNGILVSQKEGYEQALHDYFAWVAANNDRFGMGSTPLQAYQYWSRKVVAESGTNPTVVPPPAQVGDLPPGLEFTGQQGADVITATGKARVEGEGIMSRFQQPGANQMHSPTLQATRMAIPWPSAWEELAKLTNGTSTPQGANLPDPGAVENLREQGMAAQNMQLLIMCNENTVAPDYALMPAAFWAQATGDIFDAPPAIFGAGMVCQGAAPVARPVTLDGSQLATQPLLVQATGDPQTPYQHHYTMAGAMGAHVVTVHGPGHGQVGTGNPAVDRIVVDYLRTGHTEATDAPGYFEAQQ